jgi:hypothetical protein
VERGLLLGFLALAATGVITLFGEGLRQAIETSRGSAQPLQSALRTAREKADGGR